MTDTLVQWLGTGVLGIALAAVLIFIVLYFRSPWRSDELGIALMLQKVNLALLMIVILAGNLLSDEFDFARYITRLLTFSFITFSLWLDVVNLQRVKQNPHAVLIFHSFTRKYPHKRR